MQKAQNGNVGQTLYLAAEVEIAEVAVPDIHQRFSHATTRSLLGEVLAGVCKPARDARQSVNRADRSRCGGPNNQARLHPE